MNYEQDISIDEQALDVEWLRQAAIMFRYAKHAADTKKEVDEAKERLDVGKAQLEMSIRSEPEKYGISKVTESAIQSALLLQAEYQRLTQNYIDAKYENDVAAAVVRAVDQKKTALENLVKLLGVSYFAGPKAPRDLAQEWIREQERKAPNTNVKINQPTKRTKGGER